MPNHIKHKQFGIITVGIALLIGAFLYKINLSALGIKEIAIGLVIAYLASIAPDIDSRASFARNLLYTVIFGFIFLSSLSLLMINYYPELESSQILLEYVSPFHILVAQFIVSGLGLGTLYLKHRGAMHSYYAAIFLAVPLAFINIIYGAIAFLAYTGHIFLDNAIQKKEK